jgi:hypothetical protein
MTYRGRVENGWIVLDGSRRLPDGTEVSVWPLKPRGSRPRRARKKAVTLYERLKPVIGKAKHLPPDASTNLDHYLYGLPKRS